MPDDLTSLPGSSNSVHDGYPPRRENEEPAAVVRRGWRYHHCGIPTSEVREGERYLPQFGMYVSGFPDSEFGIEWMRFEEGSPIHDIIQRLPHLAFVVDDLDAALEGRDVLTWPNAPSCSVRVAMILENGAPVELMEFQE